LVPSPVRVTASAGRDASAQALRDALTALGVTVVASGGSQVHLVGLYDEAGDLAPGAHATVAMDTPYLLTAADSPVLAAIYSSSRASLEALAAVIAGKAAPLGRSPAPVTNLPASACP
jgi:beta-N-acetylhexosaminidase